MWISALLLSGTILPLGVRLIFDEIKTLSSFSDSSMIGVLTLSAALVLTLLCCDLALIVEAANLKRSYGGVKQYSRSSLDWVVWIAALTLSADYFRMTVLSVRGYRLNGGLNVLIFGVVFTSVVLLFDLALISNAIKKRARRAEQ
jgi:hypothetical protein